MSYGDKSVIGTGENRELFGSLQDFVMPLLFAFLSGALSFLGLGMMPNTYRAEGAFFVLEQSGGLGPLRSAVSGRAGAGTLGDYLLVLLESDSVKQKVSEELDLWNSEAFWVGSSDRKTRARFLKQFERHISIDSNSGKVSVSAEARDPKLALSLVESLMEVAQARVYSDTNGRPNSLEKRLGQLNQDLAKAEQKLQLFQVRTDVLSDAQVKEKFEALSALRRQLVLWESEYSGLAYQEKAPGGIEQLIAVEAEKTGRRGSIDNLSSEVLSIEADLVDAPALLLEYRQLSRDVRILSELVSLASQNLEVARTESLKEIFPLRVLDLPSLPEEPEPRHKLRYCIAAALLGFGSGALLVWLRPRGESSEVDARD